MREILFRGKWTTNHQWIEGYYVVDDMENPNPYIVNKRGKYRVSHKSVGQYTGLTDKNGKKIFEGDIVIARVTGGAYKGFEWPCADVQYQKMSFGININKDFTPLSSFAPTVEFEIIGNIHDAAERLEV